MKTLTEYLNNDTSYEINEAIDTSLMTILITQIATLTGFAIGARVVDSFNNSYGEPTVIDVIKSWWKDRKANNIAKKLAQDNDVQEFLRQPITRQRSGWRKLLQSKLDEKDYDYISKITKNSVKDKIK